MCEQDKPVAHASQRMKEKKIVHASELAENETTFNREYSLSTKADTRANLSSNESGGYEAEKANA